MDQRHRQDWETEAVRGIVSKMSEATARISQSLDFDDLLQGVLDSARLLVGADNGTMALVDAQGVAQDALSSGLTREEAEQLWSAPQVGEIAEHLMGIAEPLRLPSLTDYVHAQGFTEFSPTHQTDGPTFMGVPMFHQGVYVGHIFMGDKDDGGEFTEVDEEILVMFAAQAALIIVNDRLRQEEQQARAGLEVLVEASPVGVAVLNARTGALMSCNQEGLRILGGLWDGGQPPENLLELMTYIQAGDREHPLSESPLAEALRAGKKVRAEKMVLRASDGQAISLLVNAAPLRWEGGQPESFVATFQDMAPLEEHERLRAEFLGLVSRELRAPLAAIKGSITTLMESVGELGPAELSQFFGIIRDHSDQMRSLISDLLDVARIESGTLPVDPQPIDVYRLVDEARAKFVGEGAGNAVQVEFGEDLPLVMADQRRIVQVLDTLFANAAQHSRGGSQILVSAVREEGHVAVSVSEVGGGGSCRNLGKGIMSEPLPDLFHRYSQKSGINRPGLGLAICKGIVEAHGGRIRAESEDPSLGVRFTFTLPAAEAESTAPAPASSQSQPVSGKQVCVLAVDDDPQMLRYVRDVLTREGYALVATSDPADVPRLMAWEKPHLALVDLMLVGSDGIELMNAIHKAADIPVVFLSAYGQDEAVARAFEMGAADYVAKPFSPTELAARVKAALRRRLDPFQDEPTGPYDSAGLGIDYVRRRVTVDGAPVDLTATEYAVLYELAAHAPRVLTHSVLLQRAWGPERVGEPWLVRDIIMRLRRKLGDSADNPSYIFTEPRVGYWMTTGEASETQEEEGRSPHPTRPPSADEDRPRMRADSLVANGWLRQVREPIYWVISTQYIGL